VSFTFAVTGLHAGENPQPGIGVCRSLRRAFPDCRIVGLVYDLMESGTFANDCADVIFQLPYPSHGSAALRDRMTEILQRESIDLLIPNLDAELLNWLQLRTELELRGVQTMLPTRDALLKSRKSELTKLTAKSETFIPSSRNVVDEAAAIKAAGEIGYPLMVKGPYYEAERVYDQRSMLDVFHRLLIGWGGPVILQECIAGDEFNVMAVVDDTSDALTNASEVPLCCVRKTIISKQGKGVGAVTIHDAELVDAAQRLIAALNWNGPLELEFIRDERNQRLNLIEVNPRFPAWVDFPSTFGFNLPRLVAERMLNSVCTPMSVPKAGKFFIRHCHEVVGDMQEIGELATEGELTREELPVQRIDLSALKVDRP